MITLKRMRAFWDKVTVVAIDGCWLWNGAKDKKGYGAFRLGGKTTQAHRVAYITTFGPLPFGKPLHHTCFNPACCNPWHLMPLTVSEHSDLHLLLGNAGRPRKTHCKNGHLLNDDTTKPNGAGSRYCRQCNLDRSKAYYWAHKPV